jgi:hypothetical protein
MSPIVDPVVVDAVVAGLFADDPELLVLLPHAASATQPTRRTIPAHRFMVTTSKPHAPADLGEDRRASDDESHTNADLARLRRGARRIT